MYIISMEKKTPKQTMKGDLMKVYKLGAIKYQSRSAAAVAMAVRYPHMPVKQIAKKVGIRSATVSAAMAAKMARDLGVGGLLRRS
jgi:hypothetical protein